MQDILNLNRRDAEQVMEGRNLGYQIGIVDGYDMTRHAARVRLQPDDTLTGWLPIAALWSGSGWGAFSSVTPGEHVRVDFQAGDQNAGMIMGRVFSDAVPPAATPSGEFWLVHKSGSFMKLTNDGTLQFKGDLHVNGDVYDKHGSLDRLRQNYDLHTHTQVMPGGGTTGLTTRPDPE